MKTTTMAFFLLFASVCTVRAQERELPMPDSLSYFHGAGILQQIDAPQIVGAVTVFHGEEEMACKGHWVTWFTPVVSSRWVTLESGEYSYVWVDAKTQRIEIYLFNDVEDGRFTIIPASEQVRQQITDSYGYHTRKWSISIDRGVIKIEIGKNCN